MIKVFEVEFKLKTKKVDLTRCKLNMLRMIRKSVSISKNVLNEFLYSIVKNETNRNRNTGHLRLLASTKTIIYRNNK